MGGLSRARAAAVSAALAALAALASLASLAGCRERAERVRGEVDVRQLVRPRIEAVERATGMTFKRDPVVALRTRRQMREYVIRKLDQDLPPAELRGVEAAYRLFGLSPDTLDLRRVLIALLTEQVAGYYDPDSGTLYVGADLAGVDSFIIRTTVAHELVHALQDQYVNLDSILKLKRQNDRRLAALSVLEGQATLAQTLVMMPEQSVARLPSFWDSRSVVRRQQAQMPEFAGAPLWLRETLVFPYLGGADFVRWHMTTHPGRLPFGARMPVSTEQILDPARYAAGDGPARLVFAGDSADVVYEDDLGALEIRVLFMQLLADTLEREAPRLAEGWDGDRYRVYDAGGEGEGRDHALVWYSVWDDAAARDRFAAGLERAWRARRAGAPGRRWEVRRLDLNGEPGVRLVDAPEAWNGWRAVPPVELFR